MRLVLLLLANICWTTPAFAHDLWLQPRAFWVGAGQPASTTVQVGHGPDRQVWGVESARIRTLRSIGPGGAATDQRSSLTMRMLTGPFNVAFTQPGVHVLTMESSHAESTLPAARFNDYLKVEGLTPAQQLRIRTKTTDTPGRETYSRRAKMLVQVGGASDARQPHVTRPIGMTLEIVPERNPYQLKAGERLPVRVLYQGTALPGALIKLTNLAADAEPVESHRTDAQGRAVFQGRRSGVWLLNVVWTRPVTGNPKVDLDTTFSSLSFGFPQ